MRTQIVDVLFAVVFVVFVSTIIGMGCSEDPPTGSSCTPLTIVEPDYSHSGGHRCKVHVYWDECLGKNVKGCLVEE